MSAKPATPSKRKPTKRQKPLTPKQKRLVQMLPKVQAGKMTKKAAIIAAGYSEKSANQQQRVLGSVRNNTVMQQALRAAGFDEEFIAASVMQGMRATDRGIPDPHVRHKYLVTGAELLDTFPSKKVDVRDVTLDDLIKQQEGGNDGSAATS